MPNYLDEINEKLAKLSDKAAAREAGHPYSASCSLSEVIAEDCQDAWSAGSNVTANTATPGDPGTNCATLAIQAAYTSGVVGYEAAALDSSAKTHALIRMKSGLALDDLSTLLTFGLDDAANFASPVSQAFAAVALGLDAWTTVIVELSAAQIALGATVASLGITGTTALGALGAFTLSIGWVKLVNLANDGTPEISLVDSHTESDAASYVLDMPWDCSEIHVDGRVGAAVGGVPQDCDIQSVLVLTEGGVVISTTKGHLRHLSASDMYDKAGIRFNQLIVTPQADLGATEKIDIGIVEGEVL